MDVIECAFDGGSSGNPGESGSGWVIDKILTGYRYNYTNTNNYSELVALYELLKNIYYLGLQDKEVIIYGDSNYVVKGINNYLTNWKSNDWIKSNGEDLLHWEIWRNIDHLLKPNIKIIKVHGHSGHELNEIADQLTWDARNTKDYKIIKYE